MTATELMNYLTCFKPEQEVVFFDSEAHQLKVERVVFDTSNDGYFNHIVLSETNA